VVNTKYRLPWRVGTSPSLSVTLTEGCGFDCCSGNCQPRDLKAIDAEIASLEDWPRADAITLVGGEPTKHPDIAKIVKSAREVRKKVVLCTNGYDLGPERLCELRDLGLWGVNLRINRSQSRPGWRDSSEIKIEGLRTHYAEMVARVGGLLCGFEIEVTEGDFRQLADVLAWAERNIDRVQRLVLHYSGNGAGQAPGARPDDMAENWASAGWISSSDPTVPAGAVTWRVGRRGSDILAASPRLLKMLCEGYESTHRRHFAFLNPQSFRSQLTCWIGTLSDMSLRPLAKEILSSLVSPSKVMSPRLASQFLFSLDGESKSQPAADCTGAGWDSLSMPAASVSLSGA
jgi:hypothetical protein